MFRIVMRTRIEPCKMNDINLLFEFVLRSNDKINDKSLFGLHLNNYTLFYLFDCMTVSLSRIRDFYAIYIYQVKYMLFSFRKRVRHHGS